MKNLLYCLLVLTFVSVISSSCTKNDSSTANTTPTPPATGGVRFTNNSSNPYAVYLDGTLKTVLSGGYYIDYNGLTVGAHSAEVLQQSGYVLYATDEKFNVTVTANGLAQVSFP